MIRRPPRSTLFPTRRSSDLKAVTLRGPTLAQDFHKLVQDYIEKRYGQTGGDTARSEEHTSELQSRQYIVCRLLPAKTTKRSWRWSTQRYEKHTSELQSRQYL